MRGTRPNVPAVGKSVDDRSPHVGKDYTDLVEVLWQRSRTSLPRSVRLRADRCDAVPHFNRNWAVPPGAASCCLTRRYQIGTRLRGNSRQTATTSDVRFPLFDARIRRRG